MIRIIAMNELRVYCRSPFIWVAAAALQLILGWLFLSATEQFTLIQDSASHHPANGLSNFLVVQFLAPASVVMMMVTPLLCMNLISAERQSGRYVLFTGAPVSAAQIVTGKFIAALTIQTGMLIISMTLVALLSIFTTLDIRHLFSAYTGLLLFISVATAVSIFFSSITRLPVLAAFASFATLLLLWMAASSGAAGTIGWLAPSYHLTSFMQGLFDSRDIAYFICMTAMLLTLCIWHLDKLNRFTSGAQ
jgi:ABC-2 type transport system permease protein